MFQSLSQSLVETLARARLQPTEELLRLRPQLFDRSKIGTVRRQRQYFNPSLLDRIRNARGEVGAEVVKHNNITRMQLWHQHHLHVRLKRRGVCGTGECQWCSHPIQAQRGDDGQRSPGSGDRTDRTFTPRCPSVSRSHCRVDPRLIHKNQPFLARSVAPSSGIAVASSGHQAGCARQRAGFSSCRSNQGDAGYSRSSPAYNQSDLVASTASTSRRSASRLTAEVAAGRGGSRRVLVHRHVVWEPKCQPGVAAGAAGR